MFALSMMMVFNDDGDRGPSRSLLIREENRNTFQIEFGEQS